MEAKANKSDAEQRLHPLCRNNNSKQITAGAVSERLTSNSASTSSLPPLPRSIASMKLEQTIEFELKYGRKIDRNMDPKKLRRTISNRLSAQRSRMKKTQYINEMERKVKDLQAKIASISPQLEFQKHQRTMLRLENSMLQQKLDHCGERSNLVSQEIEENKAEVKRLKERQQAILMKGKVGNSDSNSVHQRLMTFRQPGFEAVPVTELNTDHFLNLGALTMDPI